MNMDKFTETAKETTNVLKAKLSAFNKESLFKKMMITHAIIIYIPFLLILVVALLIAIAQHASWIYFVAGAGLAIVLKAKNPKKARKVSKESISDEIPEA